MLGRAKHQAREEGRRCRRSSQAGNIPLAPRGEREREQSSPTLEGGSTKAMCASITTASRGSGRGRPGGLCSHPATRAISHSSNTLVTRGVREREQSSPTPEGGSTKARCASITPCLALGSTQHHPPTPATAMLLPCAEGPFGGVPLLKSAVPRATSSPPPSALVARLEAGSKAEYPAPCCIDEPPPPPLAACPALSAQCSWPGCP